MHVLVYISGLPERSPMYLFRICEETGTAVFFLTRTSPDESNPNLRGLAYSGEFKHLNLSRLRPSNPNSSASIPQILTTSAIHPLLLVDTEQEYA